MDKFWVLWIDQQESEVNIQNVLQKYTSSQMIKIIHGTTQSEAENRTDSYRIWMVGSLVVDKQVMLHSYGAGEYGKLSTYCRWTQPGKLRASIWQ